MRTRLSSRMHRPGRPARRDRHGRGLRGPLAPPQVPLSRTRAERFDDLVLDAVERLERGWSAQLAEVEFAVEDVPPVAGDAAVVEPWEDDPVPLGGLFPAASERPARIVVYRRPVETRAIDGQDLGTLVHEVVVREVARLLGIEPEEVDPLYGHEDDGD